METTYDYRKKSSLGINDDKIQIVYKVVTTRRLWHKKRDVFVSSTTGGKFSLEYEIGKITFPKIGKIFCFSNLQDALAFRCSIIGDTIFEGIGTNPIKAKIVCDSQSFYEKFWEMRANKKSSKEMPKIGTFKGTLLVDSFAPIKVIPIPWATSVT